MRNLSTDKVVGLLNVCIRAAGGKVMLDSDDLHTLLNIALAVDVAQSHPHANAVKAALLCERSNVCLLQGATDAERDDRRDAYDLALHLYERPVPSRAHLRLVRHG